jgi:hypothetical protein
MLLTFEEWVASQLLRVGSKSPHRFQRALNSLMSVKYAEQMFAENRLLNATYGAEAFHRLTQNERYMEPTEFRQLLDAYLKSAPEDITTGYSGKWNSETIRHS